MQIRLITLVFFTFFISINVFSQKIFIDAKNNFSMLEPEGWTKELNRPNYFNLDKNNGENLVTYVKYNKKLTTKATAPINPTINVSVEHNGSKPENFEKQMLNTINWNETYYLEHKIVKSPQLVEINGRKGITATVHFTYKSHGTGKTSFRKRIYYFLEGKKLYKIVLMDDHTIETETKLFDDLANSIKIGK